MNHASLALNRLGLRFLAPVTERQYREWRVRHVIPLLRMGVIAGLVTMAPLPLAVLPLGQHYFQTSAYVIYLILIPAFVLGLVVTFFVRPGNWVAPLTWILNVSPGCALVWLGWHLFESSTLAAAIAVLVAFYVPFLRLNLAWGTAAILPYLGLAAAYLIQDFNLGRIADAVTWVGILILAAAAFTIQLVCLITERITRQTYCSERTIASQKAALEASQRLIRRYVPPAVAQHIVEGHQDAVDTPRRRRVTILFSDIVGFTDIADRLDPESMTQVINEYMAAMADIVDKHGGTLNEFSGDGLMAVFGAPNEMAPEEQVLNAIKAGQAMQARLPALNEGWLKLGIGESLQIRIGINTGVLSVGSFGSEGRMTYTAIGLQTNIAARIQSHCEPGGILLSDASWHLVKDKIDCEPRGEVECKGVHYPIKVYRV